MVSANCSNGNSYSRGALAKQTGVNAETIRYYESIGLLPAPPRTQGGHRVYDETHLQRLSFIRRCRELGFTLDETRGFLVLVDEGQYTCAEIRDRTLVHLGDVRERIGDLQRMEKVLEQMVAECTGGLAPDCPIIETLFAVSKP